MKRSFSSYPIHNFEQLKAQVLHWIKQFSTFCFLDNNDYPSASSFQCLAGAGVIDHVAGDIDIFAHLDAFVKRHQDWAFGHFSYDLKNQIEDLQSAKSDHIHFPELHFFIPEIVLFLKKDELTIATINSDNDDIYARILKSGESSKDSLTHISLTSRFDKKEYLSAIEQLQQHIHLGDCYEINFCQEFYAENITCDPVEIFKKLSRVSANPFSCLYRANTSWLMSASPERYLKKTGNHIISQPIKGTTARAASGSRSDEQLKESLKASNKERAENVMIVDLVRNDLSKVCAEGSVHVEELFGLYSFPQVHQMISTVAGTLTNPEDYEHIFKATFPMGSMTGAPKKRVMQLIEQYERSRRGIFSGAVGYFSPEGNFDFNVVIRSMMYNAATKYFSILAGSAITNKSIAEEEYEECLVKIEGLLQALNY